MPYARLTDRAVLRITGEDAPSFLQNLVTTDLASIEADEARPGALLTPQGKILFDFLLSRRDPDGFRIECAESVRDALMKRLTLYKLRAKVAIEPSDVVVYAVWNEEEYPDRALRDARFGGADIFRLYDASGIGTEPVGEGEYRSLRIGSGVAEMQADYPASEYFPHDVLLDQNGGVSFKKGCFVGQEVVSRMQHRGTARRRLMIAEAQGHLTEGANVNCGETTIGTLLSASDRTGLAIVRTDRLVSALGLGKTIDVDGVPVDMTIPPWAGYSLPMNQTGEKASED